MIPVVFLVLGKAVNDIRAADRIVYIATALILAFALFEYFFLDAFLKVFGVIEYYVARGTIDASNPNLQGANGLMLNGIRPDGTRRTRAPALTVERASRVLTISRVD